MNHKNYVPILKWKRGEQKALELCSENVKKNMIPLIEIVPIDKDWDKDQPKKTVDEHIAKIPEQIENSWGKERPFYLDISLLEEEFCDDNNHVFEKIINESLKQGLKIIPVVNINSTENCLEVVERYIQSTKQGVCLRIFENDLEDEISLKNDSERIIERIGLKLSEIDLMIDLRYKNELPPIYTIVIIINNGIFKLNEWRNLILSCSSFPYNLTEIDRNSIETINRIEWILWENLSKRYIDGKLNRMPIYSDYNITHPELPEPIDPRTMNASAQIRYTIKKEFMIVKGVGVRGARGQKGPGFQQMCALCKHLIEQPEFKGKDFSFGDKYIEDCANKKVSLGNLETWRKVGVNHHLAFVVDQLSTYPGF